MREFFRTLAPEQFDANVSVHADGSYTYAYDGNLIFVPALIQLSRAGYLEAPFEAQLKNAAEKLEHYPIIMHRSRMRRNSSCIRWA